VLEIPAKRATFRPYDLLLLPGTALYLNVVKAIITIVMVCVKRATSTATIEIMFTHNNTSCGPSCPLLGSSIKPM
jgi:hypothetical protein